MRSSLGLPASRGWWLSVSRGTGVKHAAIAIEVYDNGGRPVTRRRTGSLVATNPEGYIFR